MDRSGHHNHIFCHCTFNLWLVSDGKRNHCPRNWRQGASLGDSLLYNGHSWIERFLLYEKKASIGFLFGVEVFPVDYYWFLRLWRFSIENEEFISQVFGFGESCGCRGKPVANGKRNLEFKPGDFVAYRIVLKKLVPPASPQCYSDFVCK